MYLSFDFKSEIISCKKQNELKIFSRVRFILVCLLTSKKIFLLFCVEAKLNIYFFALACNFLLQWHKIIFILFRFHFSKISFPNFYISFCFLNIHFICFY